MEINRVKELLNKGELDLADWIEITKIDAGMWGSYKIMPAGIFFHPNGEFSEPGWRYDQLTSAAPTYDIDLKMVLPKHEVGHQLARQNRTRLLFPCTAKQLIDFVSPENDICGSLFGCLPKGFCECVEAPRPLQEQRVDAFLDYCRQLDYPPLAIPYSGKAAIKIKCLSGTLGRFTSDTFKKAWQQATKDGFIQVVNRDAYARRPK
ncbi:hypothetical protein BKM17_17465 [Pseudomonas syringae group genomosp. 3]|nr:hypothetical protein BKM17_17465 [Pseudomonas syringae group genomosp. 3]